MLEEMLKMWNWVSDASNQGTLTFLGGGFVTVVVTAWGVYKYFAQKSSPPPTPQSGMTAGGNIITGPVTIGITLAEYEDKLKKREQELRAEFASTSKADKEKVTLLEAQLKEVEAKLSSLIDNFEKDQQIWEEASRNLARINPDASADELQNAQQALAQGDTSLAEHLFENVLGADKQRAAEAAYQLGKLALSQGDYGKAQEYFLEAVKLQPDNPKYLDAEAKFYFTLGQYAKAQALLEKVLANLKKSLAPDHPDVAIGLNNLALLYSVQGIYAKAEPLFQESLDIRKKSLAPDHPALASSLNNLAALYRDQRLYAKAEPLFHESLAILKKSFHPDHPSIETNLDNQAKLYRDQGLYLKAEPLLKESLAIKRRSLGLFYFALKTAIINVMTNRG